MDLSILEIRTRCATLRFLAQGAANLFSHLCCDRVAAEIGRLESVREYRGREYRHRS